MINGTFRILSVTFSGPRANAVLPMSHVLGEEVGNSLREDYRLLVDSATQMVELDLRSVEYIDASFFGLLLELRQALVARSISLSISVSPDLREVMRVTKLDQLFSLFEAPPVLQPPAIGTAR